MGRDRGSIPGQDLPWGGRLEGRRFDPGHCASKMKNMKKKGAGSILGQGPPWGGAKKVAGSIPGQTKERRKLLSVPNKHDEVGMSVLHGPGTQERTTRGTLSGGAGARGRAMPHSGGGGC